MCMHIHTHTCAKDECFQHYLFKNNLRQEISLTHEWTVPWHTDVCTSYPCSPLQPFFVQATKQSTLHWQSFSEETSRESSQPSEIVFKKSTVLQGFPWCTRKKRLQKYVNQGNITVQIFLRYKETDQHTQKGNVASTYKSWIWLLNLIWIKTRKASAQTTHIQAQNYKNHVLTLKYTLVTQSILCLIFLIRLAFMYHETTLDKNLKTIYSLWFWHTCDPEIRSRS